MKAKGGMDCEVYFEVLQSSKKTDITLQKERTENLKEFKMRQRGEKTADVW